MGCIDLWEGSVGGVPAQLGAGLVRIAQKNVHLWVRAMYACARTHTCANAQYMHTYISTCTHAQKAYAHTHMRRYTYLPRTCTHTWLYNHISQKGLPSVVTSTPLDAFSGPTVLQGGETECQGERERGRNRTRERARNRERERERERERGLWTEQGVA